MGVEPDIDWFFCLFSKCREGIGEFCDGVEECLASAVAIAVALFDCFIGGIYRGTGVVDKRVVRVSLEMVRFLLCFPSKEFPKRLCVYYFKVRDEEISVRVVIRSRGLHEFVDHFGLSSFGGVFD